MTGTLPGQVVDQVVEDGQRRAAFQSDCVFIHRDAGDEAGRSAAVHWITAGPASQRLGFVQSRDQFSQLVIDVADESSDRTVVRMIFRGHRVVEAQAADGASLTSAGSRRTLLLEHDLDQASGRLV